MGAVVFQISMVTGTQLLGGNISILEVGRDKDVDPHNHTMGVILFHRLAIRRDGAKKLLEVLGDLLADIFLKLDKRQQGLCTDLPHEIGCIPAVFLN